MRIQRRFAPPHPTPPSDEGQTPGSRSPFGIGRESQLVDRRPDREQGAHPRSSFTRRAIRISANLVGATGAAFFAYSSLHFYVQSHRLIGVAQFCQQMIVVVAYLVRRPAGRSSRRVDDWLLAFGGTFAGVLFRPFGAHPPWGVGSGLALQLIGVAICIASLLTLGRSFGFAAADRGVVERGPYAVVRHPLYASYLLIGTGYLLQSLSVRNALVMVLGSGCNVGRALVEERLLDRNEDYAGYRRHVPWRLVPGLW